MCPSAVAYLSRLTEASAFYIANAAVRRVFHALDKFSLSDDDTIPDVSTALSLIKQYFSVRVRTSPMPGCLGHTADLRTERTALRVP